jgi:hypothetical protein
LERVALVDPAKGQPVDDGDHVRWTDPKTRTKASDSRMNKSFRATNWSTPAVKLSAEEPSQGRQTASDRDSPVSSISRRHGLPSTDICLRSANVTTCSGTKRETTHTSLRLKAEQFQPKALSRCAGCTTTHWWDRRTRGKSHSRIVP